MADIRPFCAIRPRADLAREIAALPYDVYSSAEARDIVKDRPLSFLNIDRAETQFEEGVDIYADCVYDKARELLRGMMAKGQLVQDKKPCYYVYQLEMDGRKQTGLVACANVLDYEQQIIKRHENTRVDKEVDRIRHVDTTDAQTGPIFLAYRQRAKLQACIDKAMEQPAVVDYVAEDGIAHRVWIMEDADAILTVAEEFAQMDAIYIADGHHRCASAVKVALKRMEQYPEDSEDAAYRYFLSVLFPDEQLAILDYNRVLLEWNGMTKESLFEKLSEVFEVTCVGSQCAESKVANVADETTMMDQKGASSIPYAPTKKGEFGMYVDHTWYKLEVKPAYTSDDAVEGLDVSILQEHVLKALFGIEDPKTDHRIEFVGGIRGLGELEQRVDAGATVAFSMYPTSIGELFAVADEGRLMPPKSTWFEPKLRSGLFIHDITRGEMTPRA